MSDVPLGVFLSGGIDSSTLVAAMAEVMPASQIKTFAIGFDDPSFDESAHARTVAAHFGTDHHERTFDVATMLDELPTVAAQFDEPFADPSALPTYVLSRFAREHVTVALGGDGGDELFAGYPTFPAARWGRRLAALPHFAHNAARKVASWLPVSHANFSFDFKLRTFLRGLGQSLPVMNQVWLGAFTNDEIRDVLSERMLDELGNFDPYQEVLDVATTLPDYDWVTQLSGLYQEFYLAEDILTKTDRASMAHGLEVRAPFLDHELVEFAARLPSTMKLRGGTMKYLLKQVMRDRLPLGIADRPKKGFGIPVADWLCGPLQPTCRELFDPKHLAEQNHFRPDTVQRLLTHHLNRRANLRKPLWTLLMFQLSLGR